MDHLTPGEPGVDLQKSLVKILAVGTVPGCAGHCTDCCQCFAIADTAALAAAGIAAATAAGNLTVAAAAGTVAVLVPQVAAAAHTAAAVAARIAALAVAGIAAATAIGNLTAVAAAAAAAAVGACTAAAAAHIAPAVATRAAPAVAHTAALAVGGIAAATVTDSQTEVAAAAAVVQLAIEQEQGQCHQQESDWRLVQPKSSWLPHAGLHAAFWQVKHLSCSKPVRFGLTTSSCTVAAGKSMLAELPHNDSHGIELTWVKVHHLGLKQQMQLCQLTHRLLARCRLAEVLLQRGDLNLTQQYKL